jgi:antitoxin VapB
MKRAKVFQNGQSQAIRLPKEFRFLGKEVYIKRVGHATILLPIEDPWADWEKSLSMFSDDFMQDRNQVPIQDRERL